MVEHDDEEILPSRTEPEDTDGTVDSSEGTDDIDAHRQADPEDLKPQVEDLWANITDLFSRSSEVLPFLWVAAFILWMMPVVIKLLLGFDPLDPWGAPLWIDLSGLIFRVAAVVLVTASFPIARSYLVGGKSGPTNLDEGFTQLGENFSAALPVSILYSVLVVAGLMTCIVPGVFAALYLAPVLYLVSTKTESLGQALLSAPRKITGYSHLFAGILVSGLAFYFVVSIVAGMTLAPTSSGVVFVHHIDFSVLLANPLFVVGVTLGFIFVTAFNYCFYLAMTAAFITIDIHENDLRTQW